MTQKDKIENFINEIYSRLPPEKNKTNESVVKKVDDIFSIDLLDMSDYGNSNYEE